ncbi:hypothetical protein HY483_00405 [Candidatus Woesearchaeota archaeon]|nr:hypothetical protein [Candidatus Woesearchaeota archaeon]
MLPQARYIIGRAYSEFPLIIPFTVAGAGIALNKTILPGQLFKLKGDIRDVALIPLYIFGGALLSWFTLYIIIARCGLENNRKEAKARPEQYPLEFVDTVEIADREGLEALLQETQFGDTFEWGTTVRSKAENTHAVVETILDSNEGNRFFKKCSRSSLLPQYEQLISERWNGIHHYHQTPTEGNYAVSIVDRRTQPGFLNLLTFNTIRGPEVIAYNSFHTFIPSNEEKTLLVKATPQYILKYLAEK